MSRLWKAILSLYVLVAPVWLSSTCAYAAEADAGNTATPSVIPDVQPKPTPVPKPGWNRFTSKKRKFVVLVPAGTKKSQVQNGDLVDVTIFQGSANAYIVSYAHLSAYGISEESLKSDEADRLLENSVKGLVKGFSKGSPAELKSTKKITLQGQQGRESVVVNPKADIQAKVRSFYVDKQIYHVYVGASAKKFPTNNVNTFLNSFTLLK